LFVEHSLTSLLALPILLPLARRQLQGDPQSLLPCSLSGSMLSLSLSQARCSLSLSLSLLLSLYLSPAVAPRAFHFRSVCLSSLCLALSLSLSHSVSHFSPRTSRVSPWASSA